MFKTIGLFIGKYILITAAFGALNTLSDEQRGVYISSYYGSKSFDLIAKAEYDGKAKELYVNRSLKMSAKIAGNDGYFHKHEAFISTFVGWERAENNGFLWGIDYYFHTRDSQVSNSFYSYNVLMPLTLPIFIYRAITE